jgi:membrane protein
VGVVSRFDAYQRRHRWLGVPIAVVYKFVDDQGGYLAALITYYGFLSLFPLLLIFSTVLGFLLPGQPGATAATHPQRTGTVPDHRRSAGQHSPTLAGLRMGLTIGILVALYGGLGVAVAIQNAFNQVWGVPVHRRPDPIRARLRSLLLLGLLGLGVLHPALRLAGARDGYAYRLGSARLLTVRRAHLALPGRRVRGRRPRRRPDRRRRAHPRPPPPPRHLAGCSAIAMPPTPRSGRTSAPGST